MACVCIASGCVSREGEGCVCDPGCLEGPPDTEETEETPTSRHQTAKELQVSLLPDTHHTHQAAPELSSPVRCARPNTPHLASPDPTHTHIHTLTHTHTHAVLYS